MDFLFCFLTGLNARFMQETRALWLPVWVVSGGLMDPVDGASD